MPSLGRRIRDWLGASIGNRFAAVLLALTLGFLLVVGGTNFAYLVHLRRQSDRAVLGESVRDVAEALGYQLEGATTDIHLLATNPAVVSAVLDGRNQESYLQPLLKHATAPSRVPGSLCVTDYRGRAIACSDSDRTSAPMEPWLAEAIDGGIPLVRIELPEPNRPRLVLVEPILYDLTGSAEGAVLARYDLSPLLNIALDPSGGLARTPGRLVQVLLANAGQVLYDSSETEDAIRASALLPLHGAMAALELELSVGVEENTFSRPLLQLTATYLALSLLLVGWVFWGTLRIAPRLVARLAEITSEANRVAAGGELSFIGADEGPDEISQLARAFATMTRRLAQIKQSLEDTVAARTAALESQQELLRSVMDAVPGAIVQLRMRADGSTGVPFASQALRTVCGVAPERVRNDAKALFKCVHPSDRESLQDAMRLSAAKCLPWRHDFRTLRDDGLPGWLQVHALPRREADGATLWHGIISDVTARREAELALERERGILQTLVETIPDLVWLKDPDGTYMNCNPRVTALCGRPAVQIVGKNDFQLFDRDLAETLRDNDRKAIACGGPRTNEEWVTFADGHRELLETTKTPMYDTRGRLIGVLGIGHDITERKRDAEQLGLAASVFTHASEGIVITDPDAVILDVNEAFTRITGYRREDVLGRNPRILGSGRQPPELYAEMWTELLGAGKWSGELWNRRKNGEPYVEYLTISAVRDDEGRTLHYVGLMSDVTAQKQHEAQLERVAHFDSLTGLPNRVLLDDRLQLAIAHAQRHGRMIAVAYIDLDGFKEVNDSWGHKAGDELLVAVAREMKHAIRESDTIARLGGDEFVALLVDLVEVEAGVPMVERLLAAAAHTVEVDEQTVRVSASIGVTFFPQAAPVDADQLLRQADQAMYQAKLAGRSRIHLFDEARDRTVKGLAEQRERIRKAFEKREFVLHYQPQVNLRTGQVIGAEALLRWQHPSLGLLSPMSFLREIEHHSLVVDVGEWVIDEALAQVEKWRAAGLDLRVSVNVAGRQLQQPGFVGRLKEMLARHPEVDPTRLELEVLETSALDDIAHASDVMAGCAAIGVGFALDDFGTGYSSLTYLKRLPCRLLKIDQSFVRDMLDDPEDLAILEGVLGLAGAFRRQVIAEGVESVDHGSMLLRLGCELAQGYGIARPMPGDEMPAWVAGWRPDPSWKQQRTIDRDDLPAMFAQVEHRAWIRALEQYLSRERELPPELDSSQCRFGHWLHGDGTERHGDSPILLEIDALHRRVHTEAMRVVSANEHVRDPVTDPLDELHALRDDLLGALARLLDEPHRKRERSRLRG